MLYTLVAMVGDVATAEDCAQDTFERAFRSWKRWKPDAPAEAWLHRIAINVARSYHRWRKLREIGEILRRTGRPDLTTDIDSVAVSSDLHQALSRLRPEQAAAIIMRHHHGYSNREIAGALGVPESTIASRVATARKRLQEELAAGSEGRPERYREPEAGAQAILRLQPQLPAVSLDDPAADWQP